MRGAPTALVFYDADCAFCRRWVRRIERWDAAGRFRCLPLQGAEAARVLPPWGVDPAALDSLVVVDAAGAWQRSAAVLLLARQLGGPWWLLRGLALLPRRWRDGLYDAVARRRYCRWRAK